MADETSEPTLCMPNIGPLQRKRRVMVGVVGLVITVAVVGVLFALDAPRWARLLILLPAWGSALGFLQAREKT